jgi:hypothetical protein
MRVFAKQIYYVTMIFALLNLLVFGGTVVDLLESWVGGLAYILWVIAVPLMSPALIVLPWFEAWESGGAVNDNVFMIWVIWVACILLSAVTQKWAPDSN